MKNISVLLSVLFFATILPRTTIASFDEPTLAEAAKYNNVEMARKLLDAGADPNATIGQSHTTPLHICAEFDALETAELLISRGARIDNKTTGHPGK